MFNMTLNELSQTTGKRSLQDMRKKSSKFPPLRKSRVTCSFSELN